jgi:hypothetical protein
MESLWYVTGKDDLEQDFEEFVKAANPTECIRLVLKYRKSIGWTTKFLRVHTVDIHLGILMPGVETKFTWTSGS